MTPAGRKRQAAAMREYWAARRAKSAAIVKKVSAVAKPAPQEARWWYDPCWTKDAVGDDEEALGREKEGLRRRVDIEYLPTPAPRC